MNDSADRPVVAFDEAGNTGANLLDPNQPCFALASVLLSDEETNEILKEFSSGQAPEVHFADLKKRKSGRDAILRTLQSPLLNAKTVKVYIVHKPFMVTTKMVDLLVEEFLHEHGIDLYEKGANIGFSNMWYHCFPVYCGVEVFQTIQRAFVRMVRNLSEETIKEFYSAVKQAARSNQHSEFDRDLDLLYQTKSIFPNSHKWSHTELDPAVACLGALAPAWSDQLNQPFSIVHDTSKAVAFDKAFLEALMDPEGSDIRVGRDRRTRPLFVKSTGIEFAESHEVKQLQVADIVAGASAFFGAGLAGASVDAEFHKQIEENLREELRTDALWPSLAVTPEELGTDGVFEGPTEIPIGREINRRIYRDNTGRPRRRE